MADRGFTTKDLLGKMGIELNITPFLEGRSQFSQEDIQKTRHNASLHIHVKRAIGRIKEFLVVNVSFSKSDCVCLCLANFHPALLPPPICDNSETDVDDYFQTLDSDSDGDSVRDSDME